MGMEFNILFLEGPTLCNFEPKGKELLGFEMFKSILPFTSSALYPAWFHPTKHMVECDVTQTKTLFPDGFLPDLRQWEQLEKGFCSLQCVSRWDEKNKLWLWRTRYLSSLDWSLPPFICYNRYPNFWMWTVQYQFQLWSIHAPFKLGWFLSKNHQVCEWNWNPMHTFLGVSFNEYFIVILLNKHL